MKLPPSPQLGSSFVELRPASQGVLDDELKHLASLLKGGGVEVTDVDFPFVCECNNERRSCRFDAAVPCYHPPIEPSKSEEVVEEVEGATVKKIQVS